jgi:hypothetical protein
MSLHSGYGIQKFSEGSCFLCGSSADITAEHVFPKWLQNSYDLWNQKLRLLNGTSIPYKSLCIPCCKKCNSEYLSRIEKSISNVVTRGYEEAVRLEARTWYLWAGKIFYGILRKELSLLADRSDPNKGAIATSGLLRQFSNLHLFIQGVREKHHFSGEVPYTVLVCNLHEASNHFDFRDDLVQFSMSIRMGEVGVIVSFEDGGLIQKSYGKYVAEVGGRKLHPIQFTELYAKVCYQNSLREHALSYLTASNEEGKGRATTIIATASTTIREWSQEEFAPLLQFHLGENVTVEFQPPDLVSTWMVEPDGSLMIKSLDEWVGARIVEESHEENCR